MSTPPALPASGGNATATLVPVGTVPEEVTIHSVAPTAEEEGAEELTQRSSKVRSYTSPVSGSTHQGIDCRTSPSEVKCRSIEPDFSTEKFRVASCQCADECIHETN